jgi:hypothetical protein
MQVQVRPNGAGSRDLLVSFPGQFLQLVRWPQDLIGVAKLRLALFARQPTDYKPFLNGIQIPEIERF